MLGDEEGTAAAAAAAAAAVSAVSARSPGVLDLICTRSYS